MQKSIYLNETENAALEQFALGFRPKDVRRKIDYPDTPSYAFGLFCDLLRKKTGIQNVQNPEEVKRYLAAQQSIPSSVTSDQMMILHDVVDSVVYECTMRRRPELRDQRAATLALIGIFSREERHIRSQVRIWMAIHGNPHVRRASLSPTHWEVLRAIANGENPSQIAHRETIREACLRAGILSPGRGARRKLAKLFVAARDQREQLESEPVTPDDPMF